MRKVLNCFLLHSDVISMKKVYSLFFLFFLYSVFIKVYAQKIVIDDNKKLVTEIGKGLYYLEDKENKYINNTSKLLFSNDFVVFEKEEFNFSNSTSAFWIRLEIQSFIQKDVFLEVTNPLLDSLILFEKEGNELQQIGISGGALPFRSRSLLYTKPNFALELRNGQTKEYYLYIKSNFPTKTSIQAGSAVAILQNQHKADVLIGGYIAVMAVMLLYNLFVFVSIKQRVYFYYICHVLTTGLVYATFKGYTFEFLWESSPFINYYIPSLTSCARISILLFAIEFLNAHTQKRQFRVITYSLYAIFGTSILLGITNFYWWSSILSQIGSIVLSVYLLFLSLFFWYKGFAPAKYFLLAWFAYLIGLIVSILEINSLMPTNFLTQNGTIIGSAIEVILLSFALAYRISSFMKEREKALALVTIIREEKNNILQRQDEVLEYKMNEELSQLREAAEESELINNELQRVFSKLNEQKNIINLRSEALEYVNEQLKVTNTELNETLKVVEEQRDLISEKNQSIIDSLRYAQTIQQAILPLPEKISEILKNQFIIYKPKDIVSGDFYWVNESEGKIYVAAVDCTGHGVPGAFMSLIGYTGLETIVNKYNIEDPAQILTELHEIVQLSLKQKELNNSDGMDIALCVLEETEEQDTYLVKFSGAKRPCFVYDDESKEITEVRGTRQSIGGWSKKPRKQFELHQLKLKKSDCIYLFSDGFVDQNDERGEKFGSARFKELISSVANDSIDEQKKAIRNTLRRHQGLEAQRDDILLMGIKI